MECKKCEACGSSPSALVGSTVLHSLVLIACVLSWCWSMVHGDCVHLVYCGFLINHEMCAASQKQGVFYVNMVE